MRECLACHFPVDDNVTHCPKCDAELAKQTDGSRVTLDIAHGEETVPEALDQLRRAVQTHRRERTQSMRVIVGQAKIRDAVTEELSRMRARRAICEFGLEKGNRGAFVVRLR